MDDFEKALLEANFLFNLIASFDREIKMLAPTVKNNIGSGKYQRLQNLDHDVKILKMLYSENHEYILRHYEALDAIKFKTI